MLKVYIKVSKYLMLKCVDRRMYSMTYVSDAIYLCFFKEYFETSNELQQSPPSFAFG